jgi:hypothetical protein
MPLSYLLRAYSVTETRTLDCPRLKAPPEDHVAARLNHAVGARSVTVP